MDKTEKIKLQLEKEKFNYDIAKTFLLSIFNSYVVIGIGIFGLYIGILQTDLSIKKLLPFSLITIMFAGLFLYARRIYTKSTKPLHRRISNTAKRIDDLYNQILK